MEGLDEILTEAEKEKLLDAVILGTAGQDLSDQEIADLANRVIVKIIQMRVTGRIAEMILEGILWVTGLDEKDAITVKPSQLPMSPKEHNAPAHRP